jgi:hypothetical protein
MSNQVYSNNTRKYYALPGMNVYVMSVDIQVPAASGNAPNTVPVVSLFSFTSSGNTVTNNPNIANIGASSLTILEEGMYSIKLMVLLKDSISPATNDLDYQLFMTLTRTGSVFNGIVLSELEERSVAPGSTTVGSIDRRKCIDYTGYLKQDDILSFRLSNYSSSALDCLSSGTQLIVNKIY